MPANSVPSSPPVTDWATERRRFIEAGGNTTQSFGLGRMIGRVYSLLYLSPEPVALEEIAGQLSISKASASIAVRQLAAWQAVRASWVPGDRRDFYEAETDFRRILRDGLLPGLRKKLTSAGVQIERTMEVQPSAPTAGGTPSDATTPQAPPAEILERLRRAQNLHRQIDAILTSQLIEQVL